jgi:hypothetical protein
VAALQHPPVLAGHHILALPGTQPGVLFDDVEGPFRGALVDRKQRPVLEEVDGVVAPLPIGDLAAIEVEDGVQLAPVEADIRFGAWRLRPAGSEKLDKLRWLL